MIKLINFIALALLITVSACGGGGGDYSFGPDSGSSDSGANGDTSPTLSGGSTWKVTAEVAQDGCGERIAAVEQTFTIDGDVIDTGLITLTGTNTAGAFSAGFSESNGECERSYQIEISDLNASNGDVSLSTQSNCGGTICENKWIGSAQRQ